MSISNEKMCQAIIATNTIKEASQKLQCNEATIYRRMQNASFRDLIKQSRLESLSNTNNKINNALEIGINRIIEILQNDNLPADVHIRAYRAIFQTKLNQNLATIEAIRKTEDKLYGDNFVRMFEE